MEQCLSWSSVSARMRTLGTISAAIRVEWQNAWIDSSGVQKWLVHTGFQGEQSAQPCKTMFLNSQPADHPPTAFGWCYISACSHWISKHCQTTAAYIAIQCTKTMQMNAQNANNTLLYSRHTHDTHKIYAYPILYLLMCMSKCLYNMSCLKWNISMTSAKQCSSSCPLVNVSLSFQNPYPPV